MKYENCICDLKNKGLIILAGCPSTGKTTLSLSIANFISKQTDGKILFFSLEESKEKLENRVINDNIKILDKPNIDINYIKNKCKENERNLKLVIIDYFQLIDTSVNNIKRTIDELNLISEQYNIPIIITLQLSKTSLNKKTTLKDFNNKYLIDKATKVIALSKDNEDIRQISIINLNFIKGEDNINFMVIMSNYQLCEFKIVELNFKNEKDK